MTTITTQAQVDKLKPSDKAYRRSTGNGLSVVVSRDGIKRFQFRYRLHGKQQTLALGTMTLKDAQLAASSARLKINNGMDPLEHAKESKHQLQSFGEFVEGDYFNRLLTRGRNATDAETMLTAQFSWLWKKPISSITKRELIQWQNKLAISAKISTVNRYTNAVKAVTAYAQELEVVATDPLKDLHRIEDHTSIDTDIRWLNEKDSKLFLQALDYRDLNRRGMTSDEPVEVSKMNGQTMLTRKLGNKERAKWGAVRQGTAKPVLFGDHLKPVVLLILECGLRRQEALQLRWDDLKPTGTVEEWQLQIRPATDKSRRGRFVPLLRETLLMLRMWREHQKQQGLGDSPWVFPNSQTGEPLKEVKSAWASLVELAAKKQPSLADLTLRDLRSTYGSRLVQNGVPILQVSKLLGHSSVTITERHYAALSDEGARQAVNTLSRFDAVKIVTIR